MAKKEARLLILEHLSMPCPTSGLRFDGKKIVAHPLVMRPCRNGLSLFGVCNIHSVRVFVNDPTIVKRCLDGAESQAVT
jgi:hypothetical protein